MYIFVLFGSFFGICAILGVRIILKNRNVRKFVRSISKRTDTATQRGFFSQETPIEKPRKNPRVSAMEMQKVRTLLREVQKTNARKLHDETERLLIQALTLSPDSIEVRAQLAKLYIVMGRDAKAEALYRELLCDTTEVSFYANLALACYKQGNFAQACESYQEAMHLDPKNPERIAAFGRACMAAHRYDDAAVYLEKASERLARDTEILHMLGVCYEHLGNKTAAKDAYHRIHRLQPYDTTVKEKLAALAAV